MKFLFLSPCCVVVTEETFLGNTGPIVTLEAPAVAGAAAKSSGRNANLDALRGVAILMVLGDHFGYFHFWARIGWAGVDLFFVLSGYLISGLLFREWRASGSVNFRRFYIRRAFKILPSFYLLVVVSVVINLVRPGIPSYPVTWHSVFAELTFTQNYFRGIWGQTWSLAVEEHFYLALPITLWLMYRGSQRKPDPFRWLPSLFFAVATAELALRIGTTWHLASIADESRYLFPTHLRIDALLFGVLLRYYREFQPEKLTDLARGSGPAVLMFTAVALLFAIPPVNPVMHTVGFTCIYFGAGLLLARIVDGAPSRFLSAALVSPLAWIGYYSYSIYLWHGWIARLLPHGTLTGFIACIVAAILLGAAMAKLIEYPALAIRDRFFPAHKNQCVSP